MAKPKSASNSQNNSMSGAQPEPQTGAGFAPGGVILDDIAAFIRRYLVCDEDQLTILVDGEHVEAILILFELSQLTTEDEQWLANKLRVRDDPGLELGLRNVTIKGHGREGARHVASDLKNRCRERVHSIRDSSARLYLAIE